MSLIHLFRGRKGGFAPEAVLVFGYATAPFLRCFGISASGCREIPPFYTPSAAIRAVAQNKANGNHLIISEQGSPAAGNIKIFDTSSYPFVQVGTVTSSATQYCTGASFSNNGQFVSLIFNGTPGVRMATVTSAGVITELATPTDSQSVSGAGLGIGKAWAVNDNFFGAYVSGAAATWTRSANVMTAAAAPPWTNVGSSSAGLEYFRFGSVNRAVRGNQNGGLAAVRIVNFTDAGVYSSEQQFSTDMVGSSARGFARDNRNRLWIATHLPSPLQVYQITSSTQTKQTTGIPTDSMLTGNAWVKMNAAKTMTAFISNSPSPSLTFSLFEHSLGSSDIILSPAAQGQIRVDTGYTTLPTDVDLISLP